MPAAAADAIPPRGPLPSWPARDADHLLVRGATMAALEEALFASGLPVEALMEKAALAVSRRIQALAEPEGATPGAAHSDPLGRAGRRARRGEGVLVLVGPGHNGGDGLVVARELHLAGWPVRLWCPFPQPKPLTERHLRHAHWLGIPLLTQDPDPREGALWIDALFGISQRRPPGERLERLLAERQSQQPFGLVAVDVPTGLCSDRGVLLGRSAACAGLTCCIGLLKQGLVQDSALSWVGQLERIDLGLPPQLLQPLPAHQPLALGPADRHQAPRPPLEPQRGKYGRGRLLVVAGSNAYPGAAHLALAGATASGCGSLRAVVPAVVAAGLWQVLPHVVLEPDLQATQLDRLDTVLVGPGLGLHAADAADGGPLPWERLQAFTGLLVLDADGLNRLAAEGGAAAAQHWLRGRQGATWLTPHSGEFARLFPALATAPPLEAATAAARSCGCAVALKGARTVVAAAEGPCWQMRTANPAAARAGLGDVLAGYAAGRGAMARAAGAATEGVWLAAAVLEHALAGAAAAHRHGAGPLAVASALADPERTKDETGLLYFHDENLKGS